MVNMKKHMHEFGREITRVQILAAEFPPESLYGGNSNDW